jgi:hypothetical protein
MLEASAHHGCSAMTTRLADRRLYVADLARRLVEMENGSALLQPLLYRLLAKRLRQAAAGFAQSALTDRFGPCDAAVAEALDDRHFNDHRQLRGASAADDARARADELFSSLGLRTAAPAPLHLGVRR